MKRTHLIALLVIAACTVAIFLSVGKTSNYVTFPIADENTKKDFHVVGSWVKEKGVEYNPEKDPNYFAFYMKDTVNTIRKVIYHSNKPQDFERAERVVVVGKSTGNNFEASQILSKCPSKYNNQTINIKEEKKTSLK
ncbi:MAG: cytochrome c maturation protein CcmE [Bacteroidetes bacterium]|nr:cytochrome c maturation protein CcmE [Bacteroidota bacterium]